MGGASFIPDRLVRLKDFPATLTGTALQAWRTNADESALEPYTSIDAPFAMASDWVRVGDVSGLRTTTTLAAQMLSGTYDALLTDATGYEVGQGVSIVGAGSAGPNNNELITTINSKVGNTLTLNHVAAYTASAGATVYHDDTAAIKTKIQAGGRIYLPYPSEGYNVTSRIDFTYSDTTFCGHDIMSLAPDGSFGGYGYGSETPHAIYSRIKNDFFLKVPDNIHHTSMAGFTIKQDPLVTPTVGGGIQIGEVGSYGIKRPQPTTLKNIGVFGAYTGVKAARQWQTFVDWLTTRFCTTGLYVGDCDAQGGGDYNHVFAECCSFAGIHITMADHDKFTNCRTWTSGAPTGAALFVESVNPIYTLLFENFTWDDIPANSAGIKTRKGASVFYPITLSNGTINASQSGSIALDNGANTGVIGSKITCYGVLSTFKIDGTNTNLSQCGVASGAGPAFSIGSTANKVSIKECDSGSTTIGINIASGAQNMTATGNFLHGSATPISYGAGTRSYNIRNNVGVTDWLTSIASAPDFVGQKALVGGVWYKAKGTASTADWV